MRISIDLGGIAEKGFDYLQILEKMALIGTIRLPLHSAWLHSQ